MKILAIETSGPTFSIALADGATPVAELYWHSGLTHSERLIPAIDWMLRTTEWDAASIAKIAVSTGPGSFTGIRVGLTCARTFAQVRDIPVVGISSLDILAAAVPSDEYLVVPAIDALRGEVYRRRPGGGRPEIVTVSRMCSELKRSRAPVLMVGSALSSYGDEIRRSLKGKLVDAPASARYPRASVLALMAEKRKGTEFSSVHPLYLRRSWAEEKRLKR